MSVVTSIVFLVVVHSFVRSFVHTFIRFIFVEAKTDNENMKKTKIITHVSCFQLTDVDVLQAGASKRMNERMSKQ